ncbi:uncharacterized protein LOC126354271 [Schistocerca gregaria]|uniref:uncharacterized protein LOC126354271 n=1 Tax=Schistocerca gregaria TaxID=7010 RepID=UPI00211E332F|nr:uncharacterized protein LOC126354271 [Schistocerca gregaria]
MLTMCYSEESSTPSYSYGFMNSPAEFVMSVASSTILCIIKVHTTPFCGTSGCSQGLYTILGADDKVIFLKVFCGNKFASKIMNQEPKLCLHDCKVIVNFIPKQKQK